ncbi:MAG: adenosylcobalamin-dependent ribonucleoside-diphosphate reductase, partial [Nitrospirota bacterium]
MVTPRLSKNALIVLGKRYLKKNQHGKVIENPKEMFHRVANHVAQFDIAFKTGNAGKETASKFYKMMAGLEFLPNSPTLMNAGRELGQLSACFVIPIGDSLDSIFEAVKTTAIIHQTGGGTGFSFSKLRPKDDIVSTTGGIASGPVSFMKVFNVGTEVIKQGGTRRGANMGVLKIDHPDILEFIWVKDKPQELVNFNISVAVTDKFMKAVERNKSYPLINPRTHKAVRHLNAKDVFTQITEAAWKTGDPGVIFIDRINRANPTPKIGQIEATNPCGEQPLLPFESCNLGSINLTKMLKRKGRKYSIDFAKLSGIVEEAIHFLDNVIDINSYPIPEIESVTKANRKVGLGVMGFADMLIMLGIPYNSEEALKIAGDIMSFIQQVSKNASYQLAKERGAFPNFNNSIYYGSGSLPLRNATTTTIAPTGTLSIIAGCSSGIEPLYAVSLARDVLDDLRLVEINPLFKKMASDIGIYNEDLIAAVSRTESIQEIPSIPGEMKELFVTAFDIPPSWHVKMQAVFQKYVDNAVSKTINLPATATRKDVEEAFLTAYSSGCKGVTVFRSGSKPKQVLNCANVL